MFRIQKSADGNFVVFTLSGRIEAAGLLKLQKLLECEADDHSVVLNLREVKLVNRDVVSFLATCETRGITLANCPAYIGEWIGKKHNRRKIT
jgi:hypothetical protein